MNLFLFFLYGPAAVGGYFCPVFPAAAGPADDAPQSDRQMCGQFFGG